MRKLIVGIILFSVIIGLLMGCSTNNSSNKPIVLKLANDVTDDYSTTLAAKHMAEIVKTKTNGRITIEIYSNSQLGEGKQLIEAVQMNAIQMASVGSAQMSEFNKSLQVFEIPYLIKGNQHLTNVINSDVGKEFLNMQNIGIVGLAFYDNAPRNFYSSKPINKPEDLKGMRVRTTSPMTIDAVKSLGASATPISFGEVYSALQNNVIVGAENDITSYFAKGHYEVAKYYIFDEHTMLPDILIMSKVVWDTLSDVDKKIIQDAAKESRKFQIVENDKQVKAAHEKLKTKGVVFTNVEDKKVWAEATKTVLQKHGEVFKPLIDRIVKLEK